MNPSRPINERRILLLSPTKRDGELTCEILLELGMICEPCLGLASLCEKMAEGAAAIIVPEDAINSDSDDRLAQSLRRQPVWSDLPVIVLSHSQHSSIPVNEVTDKLGMFTLIERPMRIATLVSTIRTAMRARERQYQIREHLVQEKLAGAQIREALDAAETANSAKDQFIAVLSHELRTPLTPVVMTIASLDRDPEFPKKYREDVAVIRRNVKLEARLIDDLLDLSAVINNKLRLDRQSLSMHEVIQQVFDICASDISNKSHRLVSKLEAENDRIVADHTRIQQIFWNLLKNAVKFTPNGGEIVVRTWNEADDRFVIEVRDNGVGITRDVLRHIFDAFEQGGSKTTHRFGGLGLGLAISRSLTELHGGSLLAHSEGPGRGSTFRLELPSAEHGEVRNEDLGSEFKMAVRRLLLVEDNPDSGHALARMLRYLGYEAKVATDGASAMKLAGAESFDVMISDLGLPDMSGYDLMREMRARHSIPGIALSGYGGTEDIRLSHEAGFEDHLVKPVDLDQLHQSLQRLAHGEAISH